MRPGQSCPGVAAQSPPPESRSSDASMRPGQSCPGVVEVRDFRGVDRDPGFNEAGAIMPRSGGSTNSGSRGRRSSFNEAGAIMPRSGDRKKEEVIQLLDASMRPGQSCPGVVPLTLRFRPEPRPGFNEAGAIMPRSGRASGIRDVPSASGFNEAGAIMPRSGPWKA